MKAHLEIFARAIEKGDSDTVALFISNEIVGVNAQSKLVGGRPALVHAAVFNQKEIVKVLLQANACVDSVDVDGLTACHFAVWYGNIDVLSVLLAAQPDLNLCDNAEHTPLCFAIVKRHVQCALMLIEAGARLDNDSLLCEAASLDTDMVRALINRGVVVSGLRNDWSSTPLHIAAEHTEHDTALLSMLVHDCGIDIDARDKDGNTPCHLSGEFGNLRWLVEAGAEVDMPNCRGETPLHYACYRANLKWVVLLVAAGTNVHAHDNNKRTPFHQAACTIPVNLKVINSFIAAGANLDAMDDSGHTVRKLLTQKMPPITFGDFAEVESARRLIAKTRIDLVRHRAFQICVALQSLVLDALQLCEILQQACFHGRLAQLVPFHIWWKIATTVKHFISHARVSGRL